MVPINVSLDLIVRKRGRWLACDSDLGSSTF